MSDPLNGLSWRIDRGDVLTWLASLPEQSCDLVFGSPPYTMARLYLEDGENLGIARNAEQWSAWMCSVVRASLRVCRGLVAFAVEGQTKNFRWDAAPVLLMADLHRAGVHLRKPPIYRRVGIPGSGGPDWLRNDFELIVCATNGGKLPWSDNTAMGHAPKWAPGGEMSHRVANGARVNQWGMKVNKDGSLSSTSRGADGNGGPVDERLPRPRKPSHRVVGEDEPVLFEGAEPPPVEADPWDKHGRGNHVGGRQGDGTPNKGTKHHTKRRAGKEAGRTKSFDQPNGTSEDQIYIPPAIANPGNVIDCVAGGGQMGSGLCHANEAPFPEKLAEFFVRSFCPENGIVIDPFSGSGTTAAVSVRWGRRALCCDLRESQVLLSRRRVKESEPALFTREGEAPLDPPPR